MNTCFNSSIKSNWTLCWPSRKRKLDDRLDTESTCIALCHLQAPSCLKRNQGQNIVGPYSHPELFPHRTFPTKLPSQASSPKLSCLRRLPKLLTIRALSHLTENFPIGLHWALFERFVTTQNPRHLRPVYCNKHFLSLPHETPCKINVFHSSADTDKDTSLNLTHPCSHGKTILSLPAQQEVILAEGPLCKNGCYVHVSHRLLYIARSLQERHT